MRYLPSGQLDASFGKAGTVHLFPGGGARLYDVVVQPDGKLVLASTYRTGDKDGFAVMRLLSDGKTDLAFGDSGVAYSADARTAGVALDSLGRIVVAVVHGQDFKIVRLWN